MIDELFCDDANQIVEEGLGCCLDVLAAADRSPSEVGIEVVREPHCLQDCGFVPAELPERHLHLGDGSSQGGSTDSGQFIPFAGVIHLLLKTALDGSLQRILLSTSPLLQTPQAAPCVEGLARQRRRAAPRRINGHSGSAHEQPGDAGRQDSEGEGIGHAAIVQAVSGVEAEFLRRPEASLPPRISPRQGRHWRGVYGC